MESRNSTRKSRPHGAGGRGSCSDQPKAGGVFQPARATPAEGASSRNIEDLLRRRGFTYVPEWDEWKFYVPNARTLVEGEYLPLPGHIVVSDRGVSFDPDDPREERLTIREDAVKEFFDILRETEDPIEAFEIAGRYDLHIESNEEDNSRNPGVRCIDCKHLKHDECGSFCGYEGPRMRLNACVIYARFPCINFVSRQARERVLLGGVETEIRRGKRFVNVTRFYAEKCGRKWYIIETNTCLEPPVRRLTPTFKTLREAREYVKEILRRSEMKC